MFLLSSLMSGIKLASEIGRVVGAIDLAVETAADTADSSDELLGFGVLAAVGLALGSLVDPF